MQPRFTNCPRADAPRARAVRERAGVEYERQRANICVFPNGAGRRSAEKVNCPAVQFPGRYRPVVPLSSPGGVRSCPARTLTPTQPSSVRATVFPTRARTVLPDPSRVRHGQNGGRSARGEGRRGAGTTHQPHAPSPSIRAPKVCWCSFCGEGTAAAHADTRPQAPARAAHTGPRANL